MFNGFKETGETTDNKESSLDNTDKHRNQILETFDDYDDDFDSKLDSNEKEDTKNNLDSNDSGQEKTSLLDRIKGLFSKENTKENKEANETSETENEPVKSRAELFRESLKAPSPEESKRYNEEHGYPDMPTQRPKGGVERERGGGDPRWEAYNVEDDSDNAENN